MIEFEKTIWDDDISKAQVWIGLFNDNRTLYIDVLDDSGTATLSKERVKELRNALDRAVRRMR